MGEHVEDNRAGGSRWTLVVWAGAALLLLVPLAAMRFTDEVNWTGSDFVFAGVLLGVVCLGVELTVRHARGVAYRLAAFLAIAAAFFLVWGNGAAGLIGSEREGANLLYGAVLATALAGALVARFRAAGMALAMGAAALVQILVPVVAMALMPETRPLVLTPQVIVLTGGFASMWLLSAGLFRHAAMRGAAEA